MVAAVADAEILKWRAENNRLVLIYHKCTQWTVAYSLHRGICDSLKKIAEVYQGIGGNFESATVLLRFALLDRYPS